MSAILFPIFNFFANNKLAQWIGAGIAALLLLKSRDAWRDRQTRKRAEAKHEREQVKIRARAYETIETIKEEARDDAKKALDARDSAGPLSSGELPDDTYELVFGHKRSTGEGR